MGREVDVIVLGLGAMGSAAAHALQTRGFRVIGLDRFAPPHPYGSSHGDARIIRQAYFEGASYLPLLRRAYASWRRLEEESGRELLRVTGGLTVGSEDGSLVQRTMASAREGEIPHEILAPAEAARRHPRIRIGRDQVAIYEPGAGLLFPELCIEVLLEAARRAGAELRFDEPVREWEADSTGVRVRTGQGTYHAARAVLAAGPWIDRLTGPDLQLPLTVERQVACWFDPTRDPDAFGSERMPLALWEHEPDQMAYIVPDLGNGIRIGLHQGGESTDPDQVDRTVRPREIERLMELLSMLIPDAGVRPAATAVCLYTNTPDRHFVLDEHPDTPHVLVVSACSGHGFKLSVTVGELVAEWAAGAESTEDLSPFMIERFGDGTRGRAINPQA